MPNEAAAGMVRAKWTMPWEVWVPNN